MSSSCKKDADIIAHLPDSTAAVTFYIPQGWPQPSYTFTGNPLTRDGFALGRKLFYDVRLSRDNTISCASCHAQFAAFSHLDHALSHGIDGLFGTRNAPGMFNMAWKPAYFWDGNEPLLTGQPRHPIENPVEMDEKMADVVAELSLDSQYPTLFKKAFGNSDITEQRVGDALALFMGAIISDNSQYDHYIRGEDGGTMTSQQLHGLSLFREKCGACHTEPLFTDYSYRNNGLKPDAGLDDSGRAMVTKNTADAYKFMVPSLRNVNLTRPYMHDGRFTTLDAVLEHYRTGIYPSATLDESLANGISMSDADKADIIAFLLTLSDTVLIHDVRFAEPTR